MDTNFFNVENTEKNKLIIGTSSPLTIFLDALPINEKSISLSLIKNPMTWEHMSLLYESTTKKTVLKELKKVDSKKLIELAAACDSLDISHKGIYLLDLYYATLAKKLDITKDRGLICLIDKYMQQKITDHIVEKILHSSNKMIRPDHSFQGRYGPKQSFSALGNRMIYCTGNLGIIRTIKTEIVTALKGHTCEIVCVGISSDEKIGFTGAKDNTINVWDTSSGACLGTFCYYNSRPTAMACNNNATQLVCGYKNGTVIVWNIADGKPICTIDYDRAHSEVYSVAFNTAGTEIITTNGSNATIYSIETGACTKNIKHEQEVTAVAFSYDGTKVVTGSYYYAYLWDLSTNQCIKSFDHHGHPYMIQFMNDSWIVSVQLSKNGSHLYTIHECPKRFCGPTTVWDTQTENILGYCGLSYICSIYSPFFDIPDSSCDQDDRNLKQVFKNPTQKEVDVIKPQPNEFLPLIRALYIKNMYDKFTKNNEQYSIGTNNEIDAIIDGINQKNLTRGHFFSLIVQHPQEKELELRRQEKKKKREKKQKEQKIKEAENKRNQTTEKPVTEKPMNEKQTKATENSAKPLSYYISKIISYGPHLLAATVGVYTIYYFLGKIAATKTLFLQRFIAQIIRASPT